jgi:hypothetical protein
MTYDEVHLIGDDDEDRVRICMDQTAVWLARTVLLEGSLRQADRQYITRRIRLIFDYLNNNRLYLVVWQRAQQWLRVHRFPFNLIQRLIAMVPELNNIQLVPNPIAALRFDNVEINDVSRIEEPNYMPPEPEWRHMEKVVARRYKPVPIVSVMGQSSRRSKRK